jgi:hypothetical protein
MFETFVSSRIRRALLEHILSHPDGRFYLRGLAKELTLAVSPLRRELIRLEQLGVLKAYDEANVRFYVVDQASPQFAQLRQAASPVMQPVGPTETSGAGPQAQNPPIFPHGVRAQTEPVAPGGVGVATVLSHRKVERVRKALAPRVSLPIMVGALTIGFLVVVAAFGIAMSLGVIPRAQVTGREAPSLPEGRSEADPPAAAGEMRGTRWRLVPGPMGGFSSATTQEGLR